MDSIKKFVDSSNEWDISNGFFLSDDVERLRKLLVREHFFKSTIELPGDIVELGVFKGIGIAQYLKLKEIYTPASNKKVIGFDLFSESNEYKSKLNTNNLKLDEMYQKSNVSMENGISKKDIEYFLDKIKLTKVSSEPIYELIEGDVSVSIPKYLEKNPGFRISILYMDMDIDEPTYISLNLLYDRLVRGGVIIFDEYAYHQWTESDAVDRFLGDHPELKIKTLPWSRLPTAYIIKP
jgi:hypothetical protein